MASVVTSTLLAGLGFSGGGLPSFPSTVWPTRLPTSSSASKQAAKPVVSTTEPLPSTGPDSDASPTKTSEGTEDGDKDEKGEGEEGEREQEEEGEKDNEKKEKSIATHSSEAKNQTESTPTTASTGDLQDTGANETLTDPENKQNTSLIDGRDVPAGTQEVPLQTTVPSTEDYNLDQTSYVSTKGGKDSDNRLITVYPGW